MYKKYLFGYGTLRTDIEPQHNAESKYGCKSLGFGTTKGQLYEIENSFGVWAGVKEIDSGDTVYGEVFEINDPKIFDKVDWREQVADNFYYRKLVPIKMADGSIINAYIYFAHNQETKWLELVKHGDWKKHLNK